MEPSESPNQTTPQNESSPSAGRARYALLVLMVVYTFGHIDRQIMSILLDPIGRDLQISDSLMGLLVGIGFALFYTIAGLPIARLADRGTRRTIIAAAVAIWSVMTAASGLARTFPQLLLARIGVGVGEAGCTPPAHSLISDYFPPERRATAISIYALGVPIGTLLGLAGGGWIEQTFGWRMAFVVVGLPGLLVALLVRFTLREPRRGGTEAADVDASSSRLGEVLRFMWGLRTLRHLIAATSLQTFALAGALSWQPTFLRRVHEMDGATVGLWLGLIAGLGGGVGTYLAGWLGDRFGQREPRWYLWISGIGAIGSVPFLTFFYWTSHTTVGLLALVPAAALYHAYSGLGHAVAQSLVKPRMRAVTSAVSLFMMNLIGFGLGPQMVGITNDLFKPYFGEEAIRYSLLLVTLVMLWSTMHYFIAARTIRADLAAKNA